MFNEEEDSETEGQTLTKANRAKAESIIASSGVPVMVEFYSDT